jgi:cell division protein FtsB
MRRLNVVFTIALLLALTASLIERKMTMHRLEQQIRVLEDANSKLRQTLGELTTAITKKEKEIDDLHSFSRPRSPTKSKPSRKSFGA